MNSYQNPDAVRETADENDGIMNTQDGDETTNEYVLGVAFWTFVLFMATEAVFAVIAGSQGEHGIAKKFSHKSATVMCSHGFYSSCSQKQC